MNVLYKLRDPDIVANRDPNAFETPDQLDLTRSANQHIIFGFSIHFALARRWPDWKAALDFQHCSATWATYNKPTAKHGTIPWCCAACSIYPSDSNIITRKDRIK